MNSTNLTPIHDLIEEFEDLDEFEASQLLEELGRELPHFPDEYRVDETLVPGCQSRVWLVTRQGETNNTDVEILADSDALVVKGLVYVCLCMYQGRPAADILATDHQALFEKLGLGRVILPQRKNGLFAMVKRIRTFAKGVAGISVADQTSSAAENTAPKSPTAESPTRAIENIRDEFPILNKPLPNGQRVVFLDSGASAQKPQCVIDAERDVQENYYANAFRGRYYFGSQVDDAIEGTREKVRQLIGARTTQEIIFTAGTTMSVNLVANAWGRANLKAGDRILLNEMEHHANIVPWQLIAKETGAELDYIPLTTDGRLDMNAVPELLTKRTRLVAVSAMSNVLGTINPVEELTRLAHANGALVMVDAAQSIAHLPVDVSASDVDFLTFSGHKLYGPTGVGVVYGRRDILDQMEPFMGGGHMIERVYKDHSTWSQPPAKFEAGTMPIVQAIGLGAAIDFVQSIGFAAIHEHETRLLEYATQKMLAIDGLTIYGPELSQKGGIISFTIDGIACEDLAWRLDAAGVFTRHGHHCTMPLHDLLGIAATTRASFGVYNSTDDIDALVDVLTTARTELAK